jgi:hypothetical protein
MHAERQSGFVQALRDPELAVPSGVIAHTGDRTQKRFAVYRNNVTASLVNALRARFPVIEKLVGDDFFAAMARVFVRESPPRSPILAEYGDDFPSFLERFPPMAELPYAPDVARLEAARARAYHAANAEPLSTAQLADLPPDAVPEVRFILHPSRETIRSRHAIVTIWAMNSGEAELGPIDTDLPEDALVSRPDQQVLVRKLPPGGAVFLRALGDGQPLARAADAAMTESASFDLTVNLATLLASGIITAIELSASSEDHTP